MPLDICVLSTCSFNSNKKTIGFCIDHDCCKENGNENIFTYILH